MCRHALFYRNLLFHLWKHTCTWQPYLHLRLHLFLNMPYVSAQDRKDIEFGLSHGANVVAASFVRTHEDEE